ncbi:MAG: hypothetical protein JWM53_918 [bacterium]|nr:hypothetical protein [bacterium]
MTWLYYIEPEEASFPEEALAAWRTFLASVPARRRRDGVYQVFETLGELEGFEGYAAATGNEHSDGAEYVTLARDKITLSIVAQAFNRARLLAFLREFASQWRFRIVGNSSKPHSIEKFCDFICAQPPPPS